MIRGVVFAHADLGQALCEAVESFLGPQEDLVGLSNRDLSAETMTSALEEVIGSAPDGVIIFTALYGGSCWQASERYCRDHPGTYHLTNVNLPVLLAFASKRAGTAPAALAGQLGAYLRPDARP